MSKIVLCNELFAFYAVVYGTIYNSWNLHITKWEIINSTAQPVFKDLLDHCFGIKKAKQEKKKVNHKMEATKMCNLYTKDII